MLTVAATAVPLKTTGDPAAPLNVAWADWEPDTVPSVQVLLASRELEQRWGERPVAVLFRHGRGEVFAQDF